MVEGVARDMMAYKKLRKEYTIASQSMDSGPKPLMPFPAEILAKIRAEEERLREIQRK
jgi:hypothetical protein